MTLFNCIKPRGYVVGILTVNKTGKLNEEISTPHAKRHRASSPLPTISLLLGKFKGIRHQPHIAAAAALFMSQTAGVQSYRP